MTAILTALAWLLALAWLWKAITAARGMRRIPNLLEPQFDREPEGAPSIAVIVPARDEEQALPAALASLLAQDYKNLKIVAVDDRSTDRTATILDTLAAQNPARLRALHVTELPAGWLGKPHAMALAARHSIAVDNPDYLLFTDADVHFQPSAIRRALAQAVATKADHFVTFPTMIVKTIGEGALLSYIWVMGLWALRLWKASDPKSIRDSIGVGAFNLLRTSAYQQLGGFDALRMEILEDLTLARRVKLAKLRQRVAIAPGMVSLHWAAGAIGVVNGMTKNLFAVFQFRIMLLLGGCVGLSALCLGPFLFLLTQSTRLQALLAILSIAALYVLSNRHSKISSWYALLFPVGALLFLYSLLRSALITLRDGGITWRGTFYSLTELHNSQSPKKSS